MRGTHLRIIAVPRLIVEHVEKGFRAALLRALAGRCLGLAEHVTRVHQRRHILRVTEGRNSRVPGVDRMQHGPLPVRVLVDDGEEYLGQMVAVSVPDVRAQDLVAAITFEAGLRTRTRLRRKRDHILYYDDRARKRKEKKKNAQAKYIYYF